jgi:hypothetical protein
LLSGASRAQGNLVVNGGFELSGGWQGTFAYMHPLEPAGYVKEGTVVGGLYNNEPLFQRLSTEPATPYVLEFSLRSDAPGPPPVTVKWGTQTLGDFTNPSTTDWQTFRRDVTAEAAVTELSFVTLGGNWLVDAVSVTAVPEPTTVSLGMVAAVAMIVYRRKRK